MKNFFLKIIVAFTLFLSVSAFAQYKFTVGSIHKSVTFANAGTAFLIGTLPPNAFLSGVEVYNIATVGYVGSTNVQLYVGTQSVTGYFVNNLAAGFATGTYGLQVVSPTAVSNAGKIFSTTAGTPIYGFFTNAGVSATSNFALRLKLNYVQN